MLQIKAQIVFSSDKLSHNLSIQNELRPGINFGNNMIFSGTIIPDSDVSEIIRDREYQVSIEFPTIENEAFDAIRHLIGVGNYFQIQIASKIIGRGKILDSNYFSVE